MSLIASRILRFLSGSLLVAACAATLSGTLLAAETYRLEEPADDFRVFGVGARIEVSGSVKVQIPQKSETQALPLSVNAGISYRERRVLGLGEEAEALRSLREYEQTTGDISVDNEKQTRGIAEPIKLIVAQGRRDGIELYCINSSLSAEELDLLETPGDTLSLIALLPKTEVEVGNSWEPSPWVFPMAAGIEAVLNQKLVCRLAKVEKNVATITFEGTLNGATEGATCKIHLTGVMEYDLSTKSIAEAELTQTEERTVGVISPGLDVKAKIRLRRRPAQDPGRVAVQANLDRAQQPPTPADLRVRYKSPWGVEVNHPREWHLFRDTDQVAIFRLLKDGEFVAQCNLAPLPPAGAGKHVSEADFEADIKNSLGAKLVSIASKEVVPDAQGRWVYRVVAEGKTDSREVIWIYDIVADPSGRQASLLFTLGKESLKSLGQQDRDFVSLMTFSNSPPSRPSVPTPRN